MLLVLAVPVTAQEIRPGLREIKHDMQIPGQPDLASRMAQMQAMMKEQLKNMPAALTACMMRVALPDEASAQRRQPAS